jgi:CRISPR-associated protein Cas1
MNDSPPPYLTPVPMKDRISMILMQYGQIGVLDGAFVVTDLGGIRTRTQHP